MKIHIGGKFESEGKIEQENHVYLGDGNEYYDYCHSEKDEFFYIQRVGN